MRDQTIKSVLIVGSGAIKIGEAGEFDYSTSQAIKALKEEGVRTIVVNPNIATVHTDEKFADKVYSVPIRTDYLEQIIADEKPDGILLGFGGQTALNCGMELAEKGILEKYDIRVLGTGISSIEIADNRELFKQTMLSKGIPVPRSGKASTVEAALVVASSIGYPVIVRVAYTLGGQGSGVAHNDKELREIARKGLSYSRIRQVLVEEYLDHWKEIEYEVMRDKDDNCTIVCNMENLDPMGIHTGDSIVVAPSQTLTNREYNLLRETGQSVVRVLGIVGECNVQFALNPQNEEYRVIEVNSRLSRSSALASKATGYPIAYLAAKLALGYTLPELSNRITGVTTACFEPSLDYIVVKMPRWDFQKFANASHDIGTQMRSVGEVMAIGTCFEEALQKAVRMLDLGRELTDTEGLARSTKRLQEELKHPTDQRIFYVVKAIQSKIGIEEITNLTGIDGWFLEKIMGIVEFDRQLRREKISPDIVRRAKQLGFSDRKISEATNRSEENIRKYRLANGIVPCSRQIDTLAAEWPAKTNYLYLTYGGTQDDIQYPGQNSLMVLGSGCYRIGSSVEFDWCCVNMGVALRKEGREVIMINCNPETVSTDFDILDKLYFEELTFERVLDIIEKEQPDGVVVSVGGQIPNSLAKRLAPYASILGSSPNSIDSAEDRSKFSRLLDRLRIEQPRWSRLETLGQAEKFSESIGYPVLIRPSYVLSGSAMNVAYDKSQLVGYIRQAAKISKKHPVVISKFFAGAREVEVDAVGDGTSVFIGSIIEHVENAGVHSGDATMSIPTLTISEHVKDRIRDYSRRIARSLRIRGPFNIQFLVKNQHVLVIECNLRASRSMPFVSKTIGVNLMELAARAMLGQKVEDTEGTPGSWCVKAPQFSFMRIDKADPVLGVEMVSTGEVACFGTSFDDAFVKAYIASNYYLPQPGDGVLVTMAKTRKEILPYARMLADNGYRLFATRHTGEEFSENGIESRTLYKVSERKKPNIIDSIINKDVKLVINIPTSNGDITSQKILRDEYMIRRKATEYGIPVITNIELAKTIIESLTRRNGSRERAASGVLASQQSSVANSGPKNIEKITIPATA